jgi:pSer/pThr/pTyr-binding forkhead associated (FHA) protein
MAKVTFQVVEVTIGREEGNLLRLNDERVSRFHAKVQQDDDDIILTDLQSTNGTRVNGVVVQIRRLRYGDRVLVGRSLLLFGSNEQIAERMAQLDDQTRKSMSQEPMVGNLEEGPATVQSKTFTGPMDDNLDFDLNVNEKITLTNDAMFIGTRPLPPLPLKMTPSQAARFCEILDFLHHGLTNATDNIQAKEDGTEVVLNYAEWQRVQAIHMILARYIRAITEPESLHD